MIAFLLNGILRDKSRSLLPIIVIGIGVMLTVFLHCWINGILGESVMLSANFNNGHVKVMTRAYAKDASQMPNDLALLNANRQVGELRASYPEMDWVKRIRFGAIVDFPDTAGETRAQGPVTGWGIDLLSPLSKEKSRFNLESAIIAGKMPTQPFEAIITNDLAMKFHISIGDQFTLFGTKMDGSMAFQNFTVAGTVNFGIGALDKGGIIIDITDAQTAFDMPDATGEILGYFNNGRYNDDKAQRITNSFNHKYQTSTDEYAPMMLTLKQQEGMAELLDYTSTMGGIMIFVFVMAMSIILWNTGLIGSLRRYNEFGVRLALGEDKNHIYKTLLYEAVLIGLIGSILGTVVGLTISYIVETNGFYFGDSMKSSSLMIPDIVRTNVTSTAYYIGFIPGLASMVLGSALAGIGIYKRQTAQLFKELEV